VTENNINSFEHLIEPPYSLERGRMLYEESAKRDPAFKKRMEEGRAAARIVAILREHLQRKNRA
jgi:hypothetical protein